MSAAPSSCPLCRGLPLPPTPGSPEGVRLRAVRQATDLLGRVLGRRLAEMREDGFLHVKLAAEVPELRAQLGAALESADILVERWTKLPERRRPYYTPEQRGRILRIRDLLRLSQAETARRFALSTNTIANWDAAWREEPGRKTIGSLAKPVPPVRRFADVVRAVVRAMELVGIKGDRGIALTLARAGWKLSSRTVGRVRKERLVPAPAPRIQEAKNSGRVLPARYPNHIHMADVTLIPSLFGTSLFRIAAIFDVFSRMPLLTRVFDSDPSGEAMGELFTSTADRFGRPKHFVSDHGSYFTADAFRTVLARLSVRHRFGAIGKSGSIALIERFWRTLKGVLRAAFSRPLIQRDLEERLELALPHYAYFRPHQALQGATPAEIYFGLTRAHLAAVPPPRGQPGDEVGEPPFEIGVLDRDERLPILLPKAA